MTEDTTVQSPPVAPDSDTATELLQLVQTLSDELHPQRMHRDMISLDSDLDRNLGFNSLERTELILRINKHFSIKLQDELLAEARTPRDLLLAICAPNRQHQGHTASMRGRDVTLPKVSSPEAATTLIEALTAHARTHPERPHLTLWHDETRQSDMTYSELHRAAAKLAAGLIQRALMPGDRVAIMLPTQSAFFVAFFGTLYAGGVPVPVYPPYRRSQIEEHLRRQAGILGNAEASFLIVSDELRIVGSLLFGLVEQLRHIETVETLSATAPLGTPVAASADGVALIQYTSGSTGDPKGVVLTHANLLANIRAMGQALDVSSDDVFVSWLPLYHDMGLIGAWLGSLYFGTRLIVMRPLTFLADPSRWLRAISEYRATLSAAPNFAFELCCRSIRDEDLSDIDLGSLRALLNGAEPVSPTTLGRFTERFAPCGLRSESLWPVYGLAENSVGLAFPPHSRPPLIDKIQRLALSRDGVAVPADADDATALSFVASGRPIPGHEICIVDEAGRELPERQQGRLQFRGPSATTGYFKNPDKTRALISGNWLESGDLAYIANGDVFITGRSKDMIIKAGRNLYPHEIEELVGSIDGVRTGCLAAIASNDPDSGTERLVLVVETRLTDSAAKAALEQNILDSCVKTLDVAPDEIALVPPRTVPKTSSGKIRRAATRELFEASFPATKQQLWQQLSRLMLAGAIGWRRRLRRRVAALLYAGYWWLCLIAVGVLVWPLVIVLPSRRARYLLVRGAARSFLWLTGLQPALLTNNVLLDRNIILVANHCSYLDGLVIASVIDGPVSFVAKDQLAHERIAGPFLKRLGTLFVHRSISSGGIEDTSKQRKAVTDGERLLSFPEGTFTRMPGLLSFHLGAFLVAAQTAMPVVPITLHGTRSVFRGDQWFPRYGRITVHIGTPVWPDGTDFTAAVKLRDRVRMNMLAHCGEPDLSDVQIELTDAAQ